MTPLLAQRQPVDRAFERLYRRHAADVYRYALVVLRNPSDAEDVTQTTFMNAYRAFQRGERPRTPQNWLIAIAHNVCRQRFRQSARRPEEVAFDEEIGDGTLEDEQGPSAEDIQRALGHLAFNQRAALVMRELEGRSYAEIAEILGLSVSAVETLLFRARRALREQLEGSLTCGEAELAISKQMDRRLSRAERGALRAHLRECAECARFARSQRAHRAAFKTLAALPLPGSLGSFFGGSGAAVGTGLGVKAAAMLAAGAVVAGTGYEVARQGPLGGRNAAPAHEVTPAARIGEPDPNGVSASIAPSASRAGDRNTRNAERGEKRGKAAKTPKASQSRGATEREASERRGARSRAGENRGGRGRADAGTKAKAKKNRRVRRARGRPAHAGSSSSAARPEPKPPARKDPAAVQLPKLPTPTVSTPELPPVKKKIK